MIHSNVWFCACKQSISNTSFTIAILAAGPPPNLPYIARGAGNNRVGNSGWTTDGLDRYTSYAHAIQQERQDCGGTFDAQFMEFAKQHLTMRAPKCPLDKTFDPNTVYNGLVH